jgi:hypothetical protein
VPARARERFSLERMAGRYFDIYRELLARARAPEMLA